MTFLKKKKIFALIILLFVAVMIASPAFAATSTVATAPQANASEQTTVNLLACTSNLTTCGFYILFLILQFIMSLFVAVAAWIVKLALSFNQGVIDAPPVLAGYSITLAIANLGFVLAIIIVAIATILRRETYGVKQILWKLVVAAIMVNFSLAIARPMMAFTDGLSNYFMQGLGATSPIAFTNAIATGLAPQDLLRPPVSTTSAVGSTLFSALLNVIPGGTAIDVLRNFSSFSTLILNMSFTIIFSSIIAFTLFSIGIVFLIRYVYLAVLLILAPLAWLMWVFPNYKNLFTKWWHKFLQWLFFAPISIFFLYLAVLTASGTSANYMQKYNTLDADTKQNPEAAIVAITRVNPGIFATAAQRIIIIALALGGLVAAKSVGVAGSQMAISYGQKAGKAIGGFAARQSGKGALAAYQKAGGTKLTERMQTSRIPGVSILGRGMATLEEKGKKNLVDRAAKNAESKTSERLALELQGRMLREDQLAYLQILAKRGDVDKVQSVGGKPLDTFLKDNKTSLDQYKLPNLDKDLRDKSALTDKVSEAKAEVEKAQASGKPDELKAAMEKLTEAVIEFQKKTSDPSSLVKYMKSDTEISKAIADGKPLPFGLSPEALKAMRTAIATGAGQAFSPQTFSNFLGKLDRFDQLEVYTKTLADVAADVTAAGKDPTKELFNERVLGWIDESPAAQNFGVTRENLGLPPKPEKPKTDTTA